MQPNPETLLAQAYELATRSPDPRTQNAAIVGDVFNQVLGIGWNTLPDGVEVTPERLEPPLKYQVIEHAERNAIYDAASLGHSLDGAFMYAPWAACADCARAIIQSGIVCLVRHHDATVHGAGGNWDGSISIADEMLNEASVEIVDITGKIMPAEFTIRHAGEEWSP